MANTTDQKEAQRKAALEHAAREQTEARLAWEARVREEARRDSEALKTKFSRR